MGELMSSANPVRVNKSFLALGEQKLIRWIVPQIPPSVVSLDLTIFGMVGSIIAALALGACTQSYWFYPLVVLGVLMNWFGDSLDGSLARYRQEERPRFGFLVDHTCDLFSQILIIVAFGFSPFLSLLSSFVVLLCYMLFSAYTYIRATVQHIHQMTYIGVGATEFRILMIVWPAVGIVAGLHEPLTGPLSKLDLSIMGLGAIAVLGLGIKAVRDAREISREERLPHLAPSAIEPEVATSEAETLVA